MSHSTKGLIPLLVVMTLGLVGCNQRPTRIEIQNPCSAHIDGAGQALTMSYAELQNKEVFQGDKDQKSSIDGQVLLILCGGEGKLPEGYQINRQYENQDIFVLQKDGQRVSWPKFKEENGVNTYSGIDELLINDNTGLKSAIIVQNYPESLTKDFLGDGTNRIYFQEDKSNPFSLEPGQKWTPSRGVEKIR